MKDTEAWWGCGRQRGKFRSTIDLFWRRRGRYEFWNERLGSRRDSPERLLENSIRYLGKFTNFSEKFYCWEKRDSSFDLDSSRQVLFLWLQPSRHAYCQVSSWSRLRKRTATYVILNAERTHRKSWNNHSIFPMIARCHFLILLPTTKQALPRLIRIPIHHGDNEILLGMIFCCVWASSLPIGWSCHTQCMKN